MKLRVLSYNIHKGIGGVDRRYDLGRIAETVLHYEPDIVLLQEVAQNGQRYNHDTQVERLSELLGMRHRTYFTNVRWKTKGEYGNAILSRYPLFEPQNIDLTIPPKKARSVLHARSRMRLRAGRTRTLHIFNMHLGLSGIERGLQLRRFLASHPFAGLHPRTPIVVAGDFNDVWGTLGRKFLVPAGFRGMDRPLATFPAFAPIRALDALYVRGNLEVERVYSSRLAIARAASDHLPLVADLRVTL